MCSYAWHPVMHIARTRPHLLEARILPLKVPQDFRLILLASAIMMKSMLLLVAASSLLTATSATFVMLGDSFSDDGHGANPVIQNALSQPGVSCAAVDRSTAP